MLSFCISFVRKFSVVLIPEENSLSSLFTIVLRLCSASTSVASAAGAAVSAEAKTKLLAKKWQRVAHFSPGSPSTWRLNYPQPQPPSPGAVVDGGGGWPRGKRARLCDIPRKMRAKWWKHWWRVKWRVVCVYVCVQCGGGGVEDVCAPVVRRITSARARSSGAAAVAGGASLAGAWRRVNSRRRS